VTALRVPRSSPVRQVRTHRRSAVSRASLRACFRASLRACFRASLRACFRASLRPSLLAAFALGIAACAGDGDEQIETSENPPNEGTVVLFQPSARGSRTGRRLQASTIRITTKEDTKSARDEPTRMDDNPEKGDVVVRGGRIVGEGSGRDPTGKGTAREIMRQFQSSAFIVSQETFATLWTEFEKAGVFALPRFRGGIPPQDKPSLAITARGRTWIFIRPTEADSRDLPKDEAKLKKMGESWSRAKALVMAVLIGG
jgi:hypothetical protein